MIEGNRDKASEIEEDIVYTQNSISDTVEKLKERLSPQSLMNSVLGDDNKQGFDQIVSLAKRNPFAVALIGVGAAWLATGKEATLPSLGKSRGSSPSDPAHRSYVDHMAQLDMREHETPLQYQQRRDLARSTYFMIERNHDEDDTSFRARLDAAGESLRERTATFGNKVMDQGHSLKSRLSTDTDKARDQARAAAEKGKEQARAAAEKAKQLYRDNAVIGGLVAIAAGAMAGSVLPTTRLEQDKLGDIAGSARDAVSEQKDMLVGKAEAALIAAERKIGQAPTNA